MATTTTNFGWDIPQSTDLVKDGATAIATLGQDIDTALVDLKGGTSGQVLAKASGTDLDFAWVAQDDSNAIQNAIVDAKGDLIAATGADTPARLAVGTNGQILTADSTAATGLKWNTVSTGSLVYITGATPSASTAVNINNCFTSTYQNYLIVFNLSSSVGSNLSMRLRNGGSDRTASNYTYAGQSVQPNGTSGAWYNANGSKWDINDLGIIKTTGTIAMFNPQETSYTTAQTSSQRLTNSTSGRFLTQGLWYWDSVSNDGFSMYPDSGTMTGTIRVYGITNS
jgi:hypothetical protein